jgi:hypothetical protein
MAAVLHRVRALRDANLALETSLGDVRSMAAKPRGRRSELPDEACCVCGVRDARALTVVALATGLRVTLCGSHELMHRRAGGKARSVAELRAALGERRTMRRRAESEGDELAERLAAAFMSDRRVTERRTA